MTFGPSHTLMKSGIAKFASCNIRNKSHMDS